jgi:hypothetical protein
MTKPVRIARLVMARRKLRDLAAGELAEADLQTRRATEYHITAEAVLEETLRGTPVERAVDLLLLEDERQFARADVKAAAEKLEAARAVSDKQRVRLVAREKDLRLAEELHERAIDARNERIGRHEQGESDDRSAARQVNRP